MFCLSFLFVGVEASDTVSDYATSKKDEGTDCGRVLCRLDAFAQSFPR